MYKMFLFLPLVLFTSSLSANCENLVSTLAKKLHPNATRGPLEQSDCKVWPYSPDKTLVVMTFLSDMPDQDSEAPTYDLDIVVVNTNTKEIIVHQYTKEAISDDAIFTDHITIDTGRYQLNSSTRAFGVRFHEMNHSRYASYQEDELNLYYLQNNTIQQVLKGLSVWSSKGETGDNCIGDFETKKGAIAVEKEQHNGFNNLKINEVVTYSKLEMNKDDCDIVDGRVKKHSQILKFNGKEYVVSSKLQGSKLG